MDYSKPTLLVISGPNGAGKSTHIQTMLPDAFEGIFSFDRDNTRVAFESELESQGISRNVIVTRATRMMEEKLFEEMRKTIAVKEHFVLETPLSHPDYWRYIDMFETAGYQVQLNYLCLDKVGDCIGRVEQRVLEGGLLLDRIPLKEPLMITFYILIRSIKHLKDLNCMMECWCQHYSVA